MSKAAATPTTPPADLAFDPLAHEPPEDANPADCYAHWRALEAASTAACHAGGLVNSPADKAVTHYSRLAERALRRLATTEANTIIDVEAKLSALHYEIERDPPPSVAWRLLLASIEGDLKDMRDRERNRRFAKEAAA